MKDELIKHSGLFDKNNFPINEKGEQILIIDEDKNILLLLKSNMLVGFPEHSHLKFNPNNKIEVNKAINDLATILSEHFVKFIEQSYIIDFTDEAKQKKRIRFAEPFHIPTLQMYFSWIDNWLEYFGNVILTTHRNPKNQV